MADLETKKIYTIEVQGVEQVNDLKKSIDDLNNTMKGAADSMSSATESTKAFTDNLKNTQNSVKSVKDLKAEINGLRDKLVTLEAGSDEYKAAVQNLIQDEMKLKEVMQAGKAEVNAAAGSYNALQREMSVLRQVWKETTDEATRNEIGQKIAELNSQLKEMDASIGNFQRNVGNYPNSMGGMVNSFANLKQELRATKVAMEQLDPASQEYANAMARAAKITHDLAYQQEMIRYTSPDLGDQLNNIRGIVTNLAAGYSAVNAAMGLFGNQNEEVKEALLKVQQAMALVQGLQGLDGLWKRTEGLSKSIGNWIKQTKTATTAVKTETKAIVADTAAKKTQTTVTDAATTAQKGLNAAMKANPIGILLIAVSALVTAFQLLRKKTDETKESVKDFHEKALEMKSDYIEYMEAVMGENWKFSEEGKRAYKEFFDNAEKSYTLDYEEWKKIQLQKAKYVRETVKYENALRDGAAKEQIEREKTALNSFKSSYEKYLSDADKLRMKMVSFEKAWDDGKEAYIKYLKETFGYPNEEIDRIMADIQNHYINELWNDIAKTSKTSLDLILHDIDTDTSNLLEIIENKFTGKEIELGLKLPEDLLQNALEKYTVKTTSIKDKLDAVGNAISDIMADFAEDNGINLEFLNEEQVEKLKEQIASISPEFKKMIEEQAVLESQMIKETNEYAKEISDIYVQTLQKEVEAKEEAWEKQRKQEELDVEYAAERAEHLNSIWGSYKNAFVNNSVQQYKANKETIEAEYEQTVAYYQSMYDLYMEYANNERLTAEEVEKAKQQAAEYTTMIQQAETEKQIKLLKNVNDAVKTWQNQLKDSMSGIGKIFSNVTDYFYTMSNMHKEEIRQQLESGEITKEIAEEREKTAEEEFEKAKQFEIAETIINTLSSAMAAYKSLAEIPIVGVGLGLAAAASTLALGYAQVERIKATQYESAAGGSLNGGSTNFQLPDVMQYEPSYYQNNTGQDDIDNLNNGESTTRVILVESDVEYALNKSNKRKTEVTF